MKNKTEWVKEYDVEYCNMLDSVDGQFMSKRQINKRIAKKWNVPYDVIQSLSNESDKINTNV